MRMIRGRGEARWLPSRHHFALFRLFAFLRLRGAVREDKPDLVLAVDEDQSALEGFVVSFWFLFTTAAFVTAAMSAVLPLPLALLLSLPLAALVLQMPLYIVGALLIPFTGGLSGHNARLNSLVIITLEIVAASYYATTQSLARFVAWQFLAAVGLNAASAVILYLMRPAVRKLEASYDGGGTPSGN